MKKNLLLAVVMLLISFKGYSQSLLDYLDASESELITIGKNFKNFRVVTENKHSTLFWSNNIVECKIEACINPLSKSPLEIYYTPYTKDGLDSFIKLLNEDFTRINENVWEKKYSEKTVHTVIKYPNTDNTEYHFHLFRH